MGRKSWVLGLLVLGVFLLGLAGAVQAQQAGTLKGKVIDKNEKLPLPTVRITVVGSGLFATTNAEGVFEVGNVPAGTYKVVFELTGYLTETRNNVEIEAGQSRVLNVSLGQAFAHELTVTARREVESLQKVPVNVEVVTATELQQMPQVNIVNALNNVSGVDVETGSGSTALGTFMYIDGYEDIYIKKMVDGVDVGEIVNNWSTLNAYPEEMIQQVEVIKGGSSSVWGSNMGGIINVITKRPVDMARPHFSLRGTYSNFKAMDFTGANAFGNAGNLYDFAGSAMGNLDRFGYMVGYSANHNDGFVQYGQEKNHSLFAKASYSFTDRTFLDVLYSNNVMNTQSYAFLELPELLGEEFPYYWNYKADYHSTSDVASARFTTAFTPSFSFETQLKFHRSKFDGTTEYLDGSMFQPPAGTIDTSRYVDQKTGFTVKGSYMPGRAFSLVSGVDYYRIKADFSGFIADQPIIYVDTVAPFINMEYRIGGLGLHAGARYDYDSSFGNQLSPSFGANLNFLNASLIRVNVARTFKVPPLWYTLGVSYFDMILPNPGLRPERAWAYSAGFESQELRYLYVKLSAYYHKMTDGIVRVPADIEGRYTWGNISEFIRKGYEAEVGIITPIGLTGYFATNYNHHENTTEGEVAILTWIPTRTYKTGLIYKNDRLDLVANLRGRWIWWNLDPDSAMLLSPRDKQWVFDFRISKGFTLASGMRFGVFLDVFNLTDRAYWDRSDFPNPRRWGQVGLEFDWK